MRKILLALGCLLLGCLGGVAVKEVVAPARAQLQSSTNYEYEVVSLSLKLSKTTQNEEMKQILNTYGKSGWRLVETAVDDYQVSSINSPNHLLIFERPLP